ncbi:hypothetical protein fugu_013304 [Takifugu bimaculatus]|uniref:Uncharacterized protein n=1 Tax=Takifugu bimaculatus TaxID=433685 RepID=A0A4Z2C4M5_9TELE|nr:hypothetical protein fugu_013304 [Takifugu bimaculatus]
MLFRADSSAPSQGSAPRPLEVMEKDEVFDIVKVTEEVESYNQSEVATPKKKRVNLKKFALINPRNPGRPICCTISMFTRFCSRKLLIFHNRRSISGSARAGRGSAWLRKLIIWRKPRLRRMEQTDLPLIPPKTYPATVKSFPGQITSSCLKAAPQISL